MRTEIYYFSGTGNSLAVVRKIGERINGGVSILHWCPQNAVQIGEFTAHMPQYHHPEIKINEMMWNR